MSKKHKHHDLIVAWANGAEIEFKSNSHGWVPCPNPCWNVDENSEYRIKPNKHQYLIDAYKQGKTIQYKSRDGNWYDINSCIHVFLEDIEYRIKHKYQDVIDAYVRGETVQIYNKSNSGWMTIGTNWSILDFDLDYEFRIKHKYQDVIDAYLRGETVQYYIKTPWNSGWLNVTNGCNLSVFDSGHEYRIKPHKHQHLIDAYKEGKTIQYKSQDGSWYDIVYEYGLFEPHNDIEYRIKHKYQDVIDAYLRGETVQYYSIDTRWYGAWIDCPRDRNLDMFISGHEFRIKPIPEYHRQIDEILENFNFIRVHEVMIYLDWKWCRDGVYRVPNLHELRPFAKKLLEQVSEQVIYRSRSEYVTECGGFVAEAYKDEENPDNVFLMLRFSLTSWDNYL